MHSIHTDSSIFLLNLTLNAATPLYFASVVLKSRWPTRAARFGGRTNEDAGFEIVHVSVRKTVSDYPFAYVTCCVRVYSTRGASTP